MSDSEGQPPEPVEVLGQQGVTTDQQERHSRPVYSPEEYGHQAQTGDEGAQCEAEAGHRRSQEHNRFQRELLSRWSCEDNWKISKSSSVRLARKERHHRHFRLRPRNSG